jgi:hypothetical protein
MALFAIDSAPATSAPVSRHPHDMLKESSIEPLSNPCRFGTERARKRLNLSAERFAQSAPR